MTLADKGNTEANATNTTQGQEQGQEAEVKTPQGQEGTDQKSGQDLDQVKDQETGQKEKPEEGQEKPEDNKEKTPEELEQEKQDKKAKEEWEKNFGKPETGYDYKDVKLPEGMELNKEITSKFNDLAGKLNLSQDKANEFMALAVEQTKQTQTKLEQAFVQANEQRLQGYFENLKKDPELGGANYDNVMQTAKIAYDKLPNQEARAIMQEYGLDGHPDIVRMFYKLGKLMQDDVINEGNTPAGIKKTPEQILYGSNKSQEKED